MNMRSVIGVTALLISVVACGGKSAPDQAAATAPAMHEAVLETQSGAERGESVTGLWDEAYVQPRAPDSGYSLVALQRGKLALEVWGDRKEPLVELAKLAVSRVP